jgi:hypothetical protein
VTITDHEQGDHTMNHKFFYTSLIILVILFLGRAGIKAQEPEEVGQSSTENISITALVSNKINYQGVLRENGNLVDDPRDMAFRFYSNSGCTTQVQSITQNNVPVDQGIFSVKLPVAPAHFNGQGLWLRVVVEGNILVSCEEIIPVPYALGLRPGVDVIGSNSNDSTVYVSNTATTGASSGVYGKSSSPSGSGVFGEATNTNSGGTANGVYGKSSSPSGNGVFGWATSTNPGGAADGVYGKSSSPSGRGVYGETEALNGTTYGVFGLSHSTSGRGVYGWTPASNGTTYGVLGYSESTSGRGVYGEVNATSGTTYGVYGYSHSTSGRGVHGVASATSGTTYGIFGISHSTSGRGVYGIANATSGATYGVFGISNSTSGRGVYGLANTTTGTGSGVYGESNSPSGYGGFFYNSDAGVALMARSANPSTTTHIIEAQSSLEDIEFYVTYNGNVRADGTFQSPAADFAEMLPAVAGLEPGDVLIIDLDGNLARSSQAYQTSVAGVYSTQPGFLGGAGETIDQPGQVPLALIGRVPVKVSAENGPIQPGDLLVTSATPGHAMKAAANPPAGSVIGKALAGLEEGAGLIQMLVMLQ